MRFAHLSSFLFIVLFLQTTTQAQPPGGSRVDSTYFDEEDSTQVYVMGGVTITDSRRERVTPITHTTVKTPELNKSDASDVSAVLYEVPSARVQTNSRGESNLYLRNAGERQVSIFFDGALLNIPWDNRIDLSLVPLNAVGGLITEKGAPSVLYGANVMGGAVNILTRELGADGYLTEFKGGAGENGLISTSLTHLGRHNKFNYIGAVSFSRRDGFALPVDVDLPFNQNSSDLRTNTDKRSISLYGRGEYHFSEKSALGLSVNVIDSEKGIAPEGHKDPAVDRVRFWRYPDWLLINGTATYNLKFGQYNLWRVRGAGWATLFQQQIDQYASAEYKQLTDAQKDDDAALGLRTIVARELEKGEISFSANQLYTQHDQVDSEFDSLGLETKEPTQSYSQYTFSVGSEYNNQINQDIALTLGASFDGMITLESADKSKQDPFIQPGFSGGVTYLLSPKHHVRFSLGRKSRFPSMRELYGEALRRFLLNPNLSPETGLSFDLGYQGSLANGVRLEGTLFAQLTSNTIDQRSVDTLGSTLRQRINLPGSRIFGVELLGSWRITDKLRASGHITISNVRAEVEGSDSIAFLSEKPEQLGTLNLSWKAPLNLQLDGEAIYTGRSYSLNDNNQFEELDPSVQLNARISWKAFQPFSGLELLELFIRMDNITDVVTLYQLGLPGAGREIRGGLKVAL